MRSVLLTATVAVFAAQTTFAQQPPADPPGSAPLFLEIFAPRLPNPSERLPADVTVLEREALSEEPDSTMEEALTGQPGLHVVRLGGLGSQTSLFTRGTESDHTLVLFNGLPVNDPGAPGGAYTFGNDLVSAIDRIEIIRGPASSYYGSGAIGGVINLENRPGGNAPFEGFADIAGGNFSTLRGSVGGRGTIGRFDYVTSISALSTGGDNASPKRITTNRGEDDGAFLRNATFAAEADLRAARVDLAARTRRTTNALDDIPHDDPNFTGSNDHYAVVGGIERDFFGGRATLRFQGGESYYERGFENEGDVRSVKVQQDVYESLRRHGEATGTWRFGNRAEVVVGGAISEDDISVLTSQDSGSGPFVQAANVAETDTALFFSADVRATPNLDLSAGIRQELPAEYDETTTWRAGAVLRLDAWRARLHANVGTSFKAPTLFDRVGINSFNFVGNPDLEPEEARSAEVGISAKRRVFGHPSGAEGHATFFWTEIENLIESDFTLNTTVNRDTARIQGIETALTLRPRTWVRIDATYTYTYASERGNGQALSRRPKHTGAVTAHFQPMPELTISPNVVYVGAHADVTYADSGSFVGRAPVGGYPLLGLNANYVMRPGLSLYFEGRNLLDRTYEPIDGIAGPGAFALAGVRVAF